MFTKAAFRGLTLDYIKGPLNILQTSLILHYCQLL